MIDTIGKKYKIHASALYSENSEQDHLRQNVRRKDGFFCSELVACCLKRLGLLSLELPSTNYWPGSFSTENPEKSIQLLDDAAFSEELTVDFDQ